MLKSTYIVAQCLMAKLAAIVAWCLRAGDIIGKTLSFLTLPATLFAGVVYFDEITDYFSTPDLHARIKRASIRCNYVWRDSMAYSQYQRGDSSKLRDLCNKSKLAVSFEFSITNNDSIDRELKALTVTTVVPGYEKFKLDEVQSVDHLIQHGVETNLRRDWRVQKVSAGSSRIFEILAYSSTLSTSDKWVTLANRMDKKDKDLLDKEVLISFSAQSNGFVDHSQILVKCTFPINAKEFEQWHKKNPAGRIQITGDCKEN